MDHHRPSDASARSLPLDGMPPPRWDRTCPISPTSLRIYLQCPNRCRLQYIDKVSFEKHWVRKLEVGNALHQVMERIANGLHARRSLPHTGELREWIGARLLPEREYASIDEHAGDVDQVMEWARRGTRYIRHGNPTILRVERHHPCHWTDPGGLGAVRFMAKPDLMVLRRNGSGRYVEIVDYKTGYSRSGNQFVPILSSIALKPRILAALPEQRPPRLRFTYLWFAHGEPERIELTPARKEADWAELKPLLNRMVHEEEWPMRPDQRVCAHCPYLNTSCHPFPQPAGSGAHGGTTG